LIRRSGHLFIHPSVANIYGSNDANPEGVSITFTEEDNRDDLEARKLLAVRIPNIETGDRTCPLLIPPFALRAAVSSAVWLLLRRWGRGNWPFARFDHRKPKTLRQVSLNLRIDPGHLSRVGRGVATLSVPAFTRLMRAGGYRMAIISDLTSPRVFTEQIVGGEWVNVAKATFRNSLMREAPVPNLVPAGSADRALYREYEQLYIAELNNFVVADDDELRRETPKEEGAVKMISPSHLSRVRRGERYFSLDMLAAIGSRLGLSFVLVPCPFPELPKILQAGEDKEQVFSRRRTAVGPPEAFRF